VQPISLFLNHEFVMLDSDTVSLVPGNEFAVILEIEDQDSL